MNKIPLAVISDIHGRYDLLINLLSKVKEKYNKIQLAFTGDYIDRGIDSYEVIETIKYLVENEDAIAILGNHEMFAIRYTNKMLYQMRNFGEHVFPTEDVWISHNGGKQTIKSYNRTFRNYGVKHFAKQFVLSKHYKFLCELPFSYEDDEVFLSHAPVPINKYVIESYRGEKWRDSEDVLTWSYVNNIDHESDFARIHKRNDGSTKLAVCGHIHRLREDYPHARVYPHIIYNDSGAGCADFAPLSASIICDGKFIETIQSDKIRVNK